MKTIKKSTGRTIRINIAFLIFFFIVLLSVKIFPLDKNTPGKAMGNAYGLTVTESILSESSPLRTGKIRKIRYIVIHETGNTSPNADAKAHSKYLHDGGDGGVSWHYTVDEKTAYHHIPDDEIAFHAGRGNKKGIGVELCVNSGSDFEKTFENGAKLTAKLIKEYNLSQNDIRQHADFMDKNCPENIRSNNRWDEFKSLVEKYLKEE